MKCPMESAISGYYGTFQMSPKASEASGAAALARGVQLSTKRPPEIKMGISFVNWSILKQGLNSRCRSIKYENVHYSALF
jgi:hypothetical protein